MSNESVNKSNDSLKEQPVENVMSKKIWTIASSSDPTDMYDGSITLNTAREIKEELIAALNERNIDISMVVFSGYGGEPHSRDLVFVNTDRIKRDIQSLSIEANRLYGAGAFDDNPGLHNQYKSRLAALKSELAATEDDRADYFFGDFNSLAGRDFSSDPIHYAGTVDATIAVYDLNRLPEMDSDSIGVSLTPDEIDSALIMRFHPQFEE
jgi:hypothetical protein